MKPARWRLYDREKLIHPDTGLLLRLAGPCDFAVMRAYECPLPQLLPPPPSQSEMGFLLLENILIPPETIATLIFMNCL